jgi:hypothetical protein
MRKRVRTLKPAFHCLLNWEIDIGWIWYIANSSTSNGGRDTFAEAKPLYRVTIQEWRRLGHRAAIAHELECFAIIAKAQEEAERTVRLFGAAEALREKINIAMTPFERVEYDPDVSDLRTNKDESAFAKGLVSNRNIPETAQQFSNQRKMNLISTISKVG